MERIEALKAWVQSELGLPDPDLRPASSDASFRRYFRLFGADRSYIVMDAPPQQEDVRPYIKVADLFAASGLHVPIVYRRDVAQGFLLLSDLGTQDYLGALNEASADGLYGDAIAALLSLQAGCSVHADLPPYDEALLQREMMLFRDWLVVRHLGLSLSTDEEKMLEASFTLLVRNALEQPQVCVHRDYHSRNLMVKAQQNPGVLDFQDAVIGPVTYDLVSLLRDCYIRWPQARVEHWANAFREQAISRGIMDDVDRTTFTRWFDLMGVQRHLKASGIFARLNHRDHKPGYLADIPRTLGYILQVAPRYDELKPLDIFIRTRVIRGFDDSGLPLLAAPA